MLKLTSVTNLHIHGNVKCMSAIAVTTVAKNMAGGRSYCLFHSLGTVAVQDVKDRV